MVIKTLIMPTLGTNCYLIADEAAKVCAVIDPGDPDPRILAAIEAEGWTLACFLLSHAHYDHTMGLPELRRALPDVPVYVHPGDKEMPKPFFRIAEIGPLTFYEEGDRAIPRAAWCCGRGTCSSLGTPSSKAPWAAPTCRGAAMRRCAAPCAAWARWRGT